MRAWRRLYGQAIHILRGSILQTEMKTNKPTAIHPVWKFFQVYVRQEYKKNSICKLCDAAGNTLMPRCDSVTGHA